MEASVTRRVALEGVVHAGRSGTPIFVSANAGTGLEPQFLFGILDLHFVPEPATILLLGSGISLLVLFGRSRRA